MKVFDCFYNYLALGKVLAGPDFKVQKWTCFPPFRNAVINQCIHATLLKNSYRSDIIYKSKTTTTKETNHN